MIIFINDRILICIHPKNIVYYIYDNEILRFPSEIQTGISPTTTFISLWRHDINVITIDRCSFDKLFYILNV